MPDFFAKQEEGSMSKFNEASLKLQRVNLEQSRINFANVNLQAFDEMFVKYNYEIKFNSLNSLFSEVSAELTKGKDKKGGELQEGKDMRLKIKKHIKENPIHEETEDSVTHEKVRKFNEKSWDELEEMLFEYELMIKRFMKAHGMSLPEDDDPRLAAYR